MSILLLTTSHFCSITWTHSHNVRSTSGLVMMFGPLLDNAFVSIHCHLIEEGEVVWLRLWVLLNFCGLLLAFALPSSYNMGMEDDKLSSSISGRFRCNKPIGGHSHVIYRQILLISATRWVRFSLYPVPILHNCAAVHNMQMVDLDKYHLRRGQELCIMHHRLMHYRIFNCSTDLRCAII